MDSLKAYICTDAGHLAEAQCPLGHSLLVYIGLIVMRTSVAFLQKKLAKCILHSVKLVGILALQQHPRWLVYFNFVLIAADKSSYAVLPVPAYMPYAQQLHVCFAHGILPGIVICLSVVRRKHFAMKPAHRLANGVKECHHCFVVNAIAYAEGARHSASLFVDSWRP